VRISGCWSRVFVDNERWLVYGPRLGRLYLLTSQQSLDARLQGLLGLRRFHLVDSLADPAERIVHDLPSLKYLRADGVPRSARIAYETLRRSRTLIPLPAMAALVGRIAERKPTARSDPSEIGSLLHAVERSVSSADCYPRALLTCYLCLSSRRSCDLALGVLSPTRMMHAWCSTAGQLPYEPSPEHYLYQPLLVMKLSPEA
jgi:hypothetical protein